jgi:hypothetical protein
VIGTAVFSWKGPLRLLPLPHAFLWALSVNWAARWFPQVALVSDAPGREYLADGLGLPFTEIIELPEIPGEFAHIYELPKLHAAAILARRGTPFLHIDHDAFLRRRLSAAFLQAPFCGEFLYPAKDFLPLLNIRLGAPRFARTPTVCCATGVFGGNDTEGIMCWCEASLATALHPANRDALRQANGYQASVLLGEAALGECIPCGLAPLLPQGIDSQEDYRATGFMHLRDLKRDRAALLQTELYLLRDFHDAYFETARRFDALAPNARPNLPRLHLAEHGERLREPLE